MRAARIETTFIAARIYFHFSLGRAFYMKAHIHNITYAAAISLNDIYIRFSLLVLSFSLVFVIF